MDLLWMIAVNLAIWNAEIAFVSHFCISASVLRTITSRLTNNALLSTAVCLVHVGIAFTRGSTTAVPTTTFRFLCVYFFFTELKKIL